MSLNDESELEYPLSSGLLRQNCSWGGVCVKVDYSLCGSMFSVYKGLSTQKMGKFGIHI